MEHNPDAEHRTVQGAPDDEIHVRSVPKAAHQHDQECIHSMGNAAIGLEEHHCHHQHRHTRRDDTPGLSAHQTIAAHAIPKHPRLKALNLRFPPMGM